MDEREWTGITVLEYGEFVAAPLATKWLADLGADVIKVEPPRGDGARRAGPFPGDRPHPEKSGLFLYLNTNKRGVTLDITTRTGADLFARLAATCDVVIEDGGPDFVTRFGHRGEALLRDNPRLSVVSVTPFGRTGPYRDYLGSDLLAWHASAAGHRYLGEPARAPLRPTAFHADCWGAVNGALGAALALAARDGVANTRTGRGQHVDIATAEMIGLPLVGCAEVSLFSQNGTYLARGGYMSSAAAASGKFPCKDGFIFVMALTADQWEGLVRAMGTPDWATDPLFKGVSVVRAPYADFINEMLTAWLKEHTKAELFPLLQAHGVPCAPFHTTKDLVESEHLRDRGFFIEVDHPVAGRLTIPGAPFRPCADTWAITRPAPRLGEHNREVYGERLGLSGAALTRLARAGVI